MRLRTLQFALISVSSGGVSCFYLFVYVFFLFSLSLFACSSAGTCFTCWCVKNRLSHTSLCWKGNYGGRDLFGLVCYTVLVTRCVVTPPVSLAFSLLLFTKMGLYRGCSKTVERGTALLIKDVLCEADSSETPD